MAVTGPPSSDSTAPLRYLARQPILDLAGKVHGYELLFRSEGETSFRGERNHASCTMIDNAVVFGVSRITGGVPAFLNCTAEVLVNQLVEALPSTVVVEILEDVEPTPEVLAACRRLKDLGYRIALDDFVHQPSLAPLIGLADYIKIDFRITRPDLRPAVMAQAKADNFRGAFIAEKVETQAEYEEARAEGFTFFQGYYFCRPVLFAKPTIPANHLVHVQLLKLLAEQPLNLNSVAEVVKRDASLTYRLIRLVNSAAFGMRQQVTSIQTALFTIGDDLFRRIALLAIASEMNSGQPEEILRMAFIRARFCELSSSNSALDPMEDYLLGLFSMLPAMLRAPMDEVVADLPLSDSLREALLGEPSRARNHLGWIESYEHGDWARCDRLARELHLDGTKLLADFTDAVVWTNKVISQAT